MFNPLTITRKSEEGFTLIELSIVLVIIGLIVGGILTGQDLIKAAEQRATLAQIEKYNTAVNTFRNKYNGMPGDLSVSVASSFNLFTMTSAAPCTTAGTTAGCGDGNGLLEGGGTSGSVLLVGEPAVFWRHLSDANLIDGAYGANLVAAGGLLASGTVANLPTYLPTAKLGRGNLITVGATGGINYYVMGGVGAVTTATGVYAAGNDYLSPIESYNMDKKVDDGLPNSGTVVAMSLNAAALSATTLTTPNPTSAAGGTGACTNSTPSPATYSLTVSAPECSLRFRFN